MNFDDLKLEAIPMGRDLLLLVTGGEVHIGASSTAYWKDGSVEVETTSVPGHKEYTICGKYASLAASSLHRTVTVVMGIHYDDLNREQIMQITDSTDQLLQQYLDSHQ
jgi:hypothetical protein